MQGLQNNVFPSKLSLNCGGKLIDLSKPKVMGILNVTPDSFFDGGRYRNLDDALRLAEKHVEAGATFIDMGGMSTRPKSELISVEEESARLLPAIEAIRKRFPDVVISADTFRSTVAKESIASGADMINDVGGGTLDENMFETVAKLDVPYIMMHIQGTPQTMQDNPVYQDVLSEVEDYFIQCCFTLRSLGVKDIVIDLGFGFGKTLEHNYALLNDMRRFTSLGIPILAGLSRKSMINRVLGTEANEALNGTTALNMKALEQGASILRVHDVKEAMECVTLFGETQPGH